MDNSCANETKRSDQELQFFKTVLNNTQEAVLIIQDNKIVFHNKKLNEFTGYASNEIEAMPASHLIYTADKDLLEDGFRFIRMNQTQSYVFTFRILDKKNEVRWMETKLVGIDFNGQPAAIFYICDISEFKQAEEAVNVSIEFLNTLIDTIPNPMFYKNTRGEFIGCNNAFVNFIGKSKEAILGRTTFDIVSENVDSGFHQLNMKLINNTDYQIRETKIPHADGSLHDVISYNATFYLSDKSIGGVVGILTDISELKSIEQQLQHTEFRYKQLVKNINMGIVVFNPRDNGLQFILSEANLTAESILEQNESLLKGKGLIDIFQEDVDHEFYQTIRQVWKTSQAVHFLQKRTNSQNAEQLLRYFIYKVPSGDIVCIFNDITEIEHTQQILRENEKKYRFLIENSSDIIVKLDSKLNILFASAAFVDTFQLSMEEIRRKKIIQFVLSSDKKMVSKQFEECLSKKATSSSEHKIVTPNGVRWFHWSLKAVELSPGKKQLVAIGHDITQQNQTESELRQAKQKAEEADKLKSDFVANMSHEIRTPLNAIIGSSELLANNQISENERNEYLKYIINNGKSLLGLINEIIDSAKIEAGRMSISVEQFNLHEFLKDIYGVFKSYQEVNPNVEIRVMLHKQHQSLQVLTDPQRVRQILSNLINNALKFTDEGFIEIGYELLNDLDNGSLLKLYVKDTGIGIPEDQFETIFKRFGQIQDYELRNKKGTGLGLSISKHLAQLLGGSLTVKSTVGKGSTFFLNLKVRTEQEKKEKAHLHSLEQTEFYWAGKRILIAEDNRVNFMILQKSLDKTFAEIVWAKDGQEAVEAFEQSNFDIVLMDMQMPRLNGYEATKRIKLMKPEIPILAQTASALFEDRKQIEEAGCDDFIPKPINFPKLLQKINFFFENTVKLK